jgi:uncharacterized protein (TIGR02996 family)
MSEQTLEQQAAQPATSEKKPQSQPEWLMWTPCAFRIRVECGLRAVAPEPTDCSADDARWDDTLQITSEFRSGLVQVYKSLQKLPPGWIGVKPGPTNLPRGKGLSGELATIICRSCSFCTPVFEGKQNEHVIESASGDKEKYSFSITFHPDSVQQPLGDGPSPQEARRKREESDQGLINSATFLRAIADSPDDDALRLVYADWLDEHGQAEQAESIRAQIDLSRSQAHGSEQSTNTAGSGDNTGGGIFPELDFSARPEVLTPISVEKRPEISDTAQKHTPFQGSLLLHGGSVSEQEKKIDALFAEIREIKDPRQLLTAVSELFRAIRKKTAEVLTPSIASLLKEAPNMDFTEKSIVSTLVNQALLETGLAIVDPETKLPAKLDVNRARPTSPSSTLRFQDTCRGKDGRRHKVRVQDIDWERFSLELKDSTSFQQDDLIR